MTRLPPAVQPLWPLAKKAHRFGARAVGAVSRHTSPSPVLPRTATASSRESASLEPASVRHHVAREATKLTRPLPHGRPADHWYFQTILEHEVPETFVLDIDRGTVVGPHVAVVTPAGRLDAETSHYFGLHDWREHPIFLNPAPRASEEVDGTLLALAARATVGNYYHFLMDALPRLGILDEALPGVRPDAYLVDTTTRYHRELIGLLGLDSARLVSPARGRSMRAQRLLVPSLPNSSTLAAPATTAWLNHNLPPRDTRDKPALLYITRGHTKNTRRVVREDEIVRSLTKRGFVSVDPGALSVQEQIDHFAAARVIVAPHGAALTNLNFCRPGVRLLEMFAPGYLNPGYWSIVGNIEGSHYRYLVAPTARPPRPGANLLGVMHDIDIDPSTVDDALDDLLADASLRWPPRRTSEGPPMTTQQSGAGPTDQTLANRLRERAKLAVRGVLQRADLDLSRGTYTNRLVRTLESRAIDSVLDIGANVGQYATLTRRSGFTGRIISCEPLSGAFGELRDRAARDAQWLPLNTAVGREPGTTTINVSANSFSSSVLDMTDAHRDSAPGSGYISSETVPVTTVRALCSQHAVDPSRTLLKIDTQGYEEEVLAGAGDLVGEFAAIQLEMSFVELYTGQQLFDDLYARMRDHGYRLQILESGFSDAAGRMMQCDGLFVRTIDD